MFRRAAFYSQLKSKVGNILAKATSPTNKPEHRWRSYSSKCTLTPPIHKPVASSSLPSHVPPSPAPLFASLLLQLSLAISRHIDTPF